MVFTRRLIMSICGIKQRTINSTQTDNVVYYDNWGGGDACEFAHIEFICITKARFVRLLYFNQDLFFMLLSFQYVLYLYGST